METCCNLLQSAHPLWTAVLASAAPAKRKLDLDVLARAERSRGVDVLSRAERSRGVDLLAPTTG